MLRDIGFSASDGWLLLLVGCAGIYLAFLMYRSRLQGIHRLLLGVRVAALVLLIGLLMEPILALTLHTQRLPLVVLLIDDSESMKIADGDTARFEVAKAVLNDPSLKNLRDRARVTHFRFSDVLTPMRGEEDLTWAGRATDLAGALDGLRERTMGKGLPLWCSFQMADKIWVGVPSGQRSIWARQSLQWERAIQSRPKTCP